MMPAEPGALIKYMRTQICTFCQSGGGFPTETRGWVSQNLNLKYKKQMNLILKPESKHFLTAFNSRWELFHPAKDFPVEVLLEKSINENL